jgi:hypothetical protein
MKQFVVADLDASGALLMRERYTYETLERVPGAVELIAQMSAALYRSPQEFEARLDGSRLAMRWRAVSDSSGIATVRWGRTLVAVSMLVSGLNADTDSATLGAVQRHVMTELRDTGFEPGFALVEIPDRPLLATMNLREPPVDEAEKASGGLSDLTAERMRLALVDRCFAAAYFRQMGLA